MFHTSICAFDLRNSQGEDARGNLIQKHPKPSHGFVYAASYEGANGLVKIGESRFFPTRRLADLTMRTAAPSSLKLLFAFETPFRLATEKSAHDALRRAHSKGEWFRVGSDDLLGLMFGLAAMHEWRKYGWRLWTTPDYLGMCDAATIRTLCAAGMGALPSDDGFAGSPAAGAALAA